MVRTERNRRVREGAGATRVDASLSSLIRYRRRVTSGDREAWAALLPRAPIRFAPDFQWGVASSAFQAEGGDVANDWVEAARAGRVPPNPGNGFWERAEDDLRRVAALGFRHYRLSLEWSRIEPEEDRFDERALDRYRAICDAAIAAGVTPWVNFFHFTHPSWFARRGGFLARDGRTPFLRYLERAAAALRGHARHFHVSNESLAYVASSYLIGSNPPFVSDQSSAYAMTRTVLELQADGYRLLKAGDPGATVATIEVYLDVHARDGSDAGQRAAAQQLDAWYHGVLLEALATGWIRLPEREPVEVPHLRRALDVYGLNYYTPVYLGAADGDGGFGSGGAGPRDALGRVVDPGGMERGLLRVARALPGVPLLVTENGCPTSDETFRIRYLAAHLAALDSARRAGAPVNGYFHWTAVDNYEWQHGYDERARFGLFAFDPHTRARHLKSSGEWLGGVILSGALDPASVP
jgi:beta-glucosidase